MRAVFGALTIVLAGLALFEVTMQPSGPERAQLAVVFAVMAGITAVAAVVLPRFARHTRSLRTTVAVLSLVSFAVVFIGLLGAANGMFISDHDLTLTLVVLGVGAIAAIVFAVIVSGRLTADLDLIADTADQVAEGNLEMRTEVARADEVGRVAHAVDEMAARLAAAAEQRSRDDQARREFFAAVGHDLRTPLASLQAAVEALQDGVAADPARFLAAMDRDIVALSALVDDLFLLAQIDAGFVAMEPVPVDLTELADETVEVLRPLATREGVHLRLEADHRVAVMGRPEAVSRVMRNLLDNAIRFAPEDSAVVVRVASNDGSVLVLDEGPGFDDAFIADAFDRFSRDDPSRGRDGGGAGLGLAIASEFVTALGGEIWAEPGPGGKVGFRLPTPSGIR